MSRSVLESRRVLDVSQFARSTDMRVLLIITSAIIYQCNECAAKCTRDNINDEVSFDSAIYGIANCININANDVKELEQRGCNYRSNKYGHVEKTSAVSAARVRLMCGNLPSGLDGMPVSFNYPVDASTLSADDFLIDIYNETDQTVKQVKPLCVTLGPENEKNELQTVAMIGKFGDGKGNSTYPVKVEVVSDLCFKTENGDTVNGKGLIRERDPNMNYMNARIFILHANIQPFSVKGESSWKPLVGT